MSLLLVIVGTCFYEHALSSKTVCPSARAKGAGCRLLAGLPLAASSATNPNKEVAKSLLCPPITQNNHGILDSGCTGIFFGYNTKGLVNILPAQLSIPVSLPDKREIQSTHTGMLPIPKLPLQAHLFKELKETALIGLGPLCDAGCTVSFNKNTAFVYLEN